MTYMQKIATVSPAMGLVVWVALCVASGGCADNHVTRLQDTAEFKQAILQSDKPVLVDFFKGGCPTCIPVDGMMATLDEEYKGRVTVAKFMLMQPYFAVTSPELREQYDIAFYPTVILFVNGQEKWRFISNYRMDDYRKAMDEALVAAPMRSAPINATPRDK